MIGLTHRLAWPSQIGRNRLVVVQVPLYEGDSRGSPVHYANRIAVDGTEFVWLVRREISSDRPKSITISGAFVPDRKEIDGDPH